MHPKLSGNGLLSSWAVQNRSQVCRSISQSEVILEYMRDPAAQKQSQARNPRNIETNTVFEGARIEGVRPRPRNSSRSLVPAGRNFWRWGRDSARASSMIAPRKTAISGILIVKIAYHKARLRHVGLPAKPLPRRAQRCKELNS